MGKSLNMPDSSLMLDLSNILGITVNELLTGEIINEKEYMKKAEEKLIEMTKIKEERDKELLTMEIFIGVIVSINMITCILLASFIDMQDWLRVLLITIGIIPFVIGICYALRIEQIAGYYECGKCHHKYVPTYRNVFFAIHVNRTRFLKCPKCHEKSWNKKVIS